MRQSLDIDWTRQRPTSGFLQQVDYDDGDDNDFGCGRCNDMFYYVYTYRSIFILNDCGSKQIIKFMTSGSPTKRHHIDFARQFSYG